MVATCPWEQGRVTTGLRVRVGCRPWAQLRPLPPACCFCSPGPRFPTHWSVESELSSVLTLTLTQSRPPSQDGITCSPHLVGARWTLSLAGAFRP